MYLFALREGWEKAWQEEVWVICAHVVVESFQETTLPAYELFSLCFRGTLKSQGKCLNFSSTKGPAREVTFSLCPSHPARHNDHERSWPFELCSAPTSQFLPLLHSLLGLCLCSEFIFPYLPLHDFFALFFTNSNSRNNTVLVAWEHTLHKLGKRKIVPFWLGPSWGRQLILEGWVGLRYWRRGRGREAITSLSRSKTLSGRWGLRLKQTFMYKIYKVPAMGGYL